jgi:hypothetical protein
MTLSKKIMIIYAAILFSKLNLTASIRIVADCVALSCQATINLKRATTLDITNEKAIIFIHC